MRCLKKKNIIICLVLTLCAGLYSHQLWATIAMKIPFSNHMVLQRNAKVNIWGTGAPGERVTVSFNNQEKTATTGSDGNWRLQLDPMVAAGPLTMNVTGSNRITFTDIYIGEVWQCGGQSNMDLTLTATDWGGAFNTEISKANFPMLRFMKTRRGNGTWNVMSPATARECSATGYFFGKDLLQNLDCAVGLMVTAVGGTTIDQWFDPVSRQTFRGKLDPAVTPGDMYEQFVKPVIPYTIKGTVWIQGEQNASKGFGAADYGDRFKAVISNWRNAWGQGEFPFYFGQITGFNTTQDAPFPNSRGAQVREGQRQALELPNTAMSVMLDISGGGWHYKNKSEAGRRLALAPKALLYDKNLEYSGPLYQSATVSGNNVTINFSHAKGLTTNDGKVPYGIGIAGKDGVWYFADKATISGNTIVVSSTRVPNPTRINMGWNDRPRVNLYNGDGLQASPFLGDLTAAKPGDCFGVEEGTAIVDDCGRCVGGTTGKSACNYIAEAEDACSYDGLTETTNAGYKGTNYVNVSNELGASVSFVVLAEEEVDARLIVRYANGGTEIRPGQVKLNGTTLTNVLNFSSTALWTTWVVDEIPVTLTKGINEIVLSATTSGGLPNMDQIGFEGNGISSTNCGNLTHYVETDRTKQIVVFPNPSVSGFNLYVPEASKVRIRNMQGAIIEEQTVSGEWNFGEKYVPGNYIVEIVGESSPVIYKLTKL